MRTAKQDFVSISARLNKVRRILNRQSSASGALEAIAKLIELRVAIRKVFGDRILSVLEYEAKAK
jgi:hypothetical protein